MNCNVLQMLPLKKKDLKVLVKLAEAFLTNLALKESQYLYFHF